ncbi:mannose-6-phosphate isomerase, class I [Vibrio sp. SCSIO 43136]|uniref:mannose-6-phosphate isomerase, class I n=1 Tax=Vibrio sp. SCSIO 43136 TaxID=2819101 RepID=UPI0020763D29|nr:mannose-6-phosphate isomerase, class I [Vibrio sp. SCSIO 43136]USD67393.1 mannose-6-phosphate isomerase, class I [Vibrio sp. SCSIO 43136]
MIEIKGTLKNYPWGGKHFLPMMLTDDNATQPVAELWLGDHPSGSATLVDGSSLAEWITAAPDVRLGERSVERFGARLPYLLKVLDVKEQLSIQVHPTLEQAKQGYAFEQRQAIPMEKRSYKDDNHKPELMLALSDFYLLHGFRNVTGSVTELNKYPEFERLAQLLNQQGLEKFVATIFQLPTPNLIELIEPVIERYAQAYDQSELSKSDPCFWFMRAAKRAGRDGMPLDAGLVMIFIMNLMYVPKGGVVYQGAGVPHAYLEGQNIELMANSDNVVRGGLTPKHIDINELLNITTFEPITPICLTGRPTEDGGIDYLVPEDDFELREYRLDAGGRLNTPESQSPCIWFVLSGEVKLGNQRHYSGAGSAFYQRPGEFCVFNASSDCVLYRASCRV